MVLAYQNCCKNQFSINPSDALWDLKMESNISGKHSLQFYFIEVVTSFFLTKPQDSQTFIHIYSGPFQEKQQTTNYYKTKENKSHSEEDWAEMISFWTLSLDFSSSVCSRMQSSLNFPVAQWCLLAVFFFKQCLHLKPNGWTAVSMGPKYHKPMGANDSLQL